MNFFKQEGAGLDIGSRFAKYVQLVRKGDKIHLEKFFFVDFQGIQSGANSQAKQEEMISAAIEVKKKKGSRVGVAISSKDQFIFDLKLPNMPEEELVLVLENEIEQKLNAPLKNFVCDYVQFSPEEGGMIIRAFCVRGAAVDQSLDAIGRIRLKTDLILPETLANLEMLKFNGYLDSALNSILIDIGNRHTVCSLISNKELVNSNAISVGFGSAIEKIGAKLNIGTDEAALLLDRAYGLEEGVPNRDLVKEILQEVYESILTQVQTSVDYFRSLSGGKQVENIYLLGGGAQYPGLIGLIQDVFGIPSERVNPLKKIEIYSDGNQEVDVATIASILGPSIGLALKEIA